MEHLNPPSWPRPHGYSNGVAASGRLVFVAGQIGQTYGWRAPFAIYLLSFVALILGWIFLPATARRVLSTSSSFSLG